MKKKETPAMADDTVDTHAKRQPFTKSLHREWTADYTPAMADTPTVEQAKAAYLAARSVWFNYCGTNEAALLDANAKLDALIAAVSAEHPKLKAVTARCRDCGSFCDDIEFEYEQA